MTFLTDNLDCIFYLYGLVFLVLAAVCFSQSSLDRSATAWNWLALFGLLHGTNEWLDGAAHCLEDPWFLIPIRLTALLLSFVFLMEFGRASTHVVQRWRPGYYIYAYLILPVGLLIWLPQEEGIAICCYLVAFPATLWAAFALWRTSQRVHAEQRRPLQVAAVGCALYAVAAGLIVPSVALPPASFLNTSTFLAATGIPVQAVRAVLAGIMTWGLVRYFRSLPGSPLRMAADAGMQAPRQPWFALLALLALVGCIGTAHTGKYRDRDQRRDLLELANATAAMLDRQHIKALRGTPEDLDQPAYALLKGKLEAVRMQVPKTRFVYLMLRHNQLLHFLVDAEAPTSKDFSPPGQAYDETSSAELEIFTTNQGVVEGPRQDRWGSWVTAWAPVWDQDTKQVIALLGMDVEASLWLADVARKRFLVLLAFQMASLAFLAVYTGYHTNSITTMRLAFSEKRFHAIFDSANDAITIHDLVSGDILEANRSAYELLGHNPGDVPVCSITPFTAQAPPFDGQHADALVRAAAAGQPQLFEWQVQHRNGSRIWVEVSLRKAMVGSRECLIAVVRSIGDRKAAEDALRRSRDELEQRVKERTAELAAANVRLAADIQIRVEAETALRESEARFRTLAETETIGILIFQGTKFLYANPGVTRITGYAWEDAARMAFWERVHPDFKEEVKQRGLARQRGEAVPSQYSLKVICRDGEEKWLYLSVGAVTYMGTPAVIVTFVDITEHQRLEQEREALGLRLLQSRNLESLGAMAAGIAHDFNNLLMAILGNADLILMSLPPNSAYHTYLEDIKAAGRRAAAIADNMLIYSGRGKFVGENLDTGEFLRSLGPFLTAFSSPKLDVVFEAPAQLPHINANPNQIRQMIMNLVTNAAEAVGDRPGRITVSTGTVSLTRPQLAALHMGDRLAEGTHVFVQVEDTGAGMDASTAARIFDPFFSTKFIGRGLGLPAVHGIVKSHGGAIQVTSAIGKGSAVRVVFPIVSTARPQAAVPDNGTATAAGAVATLGEPPLSHEPHRITVLVVDDEDSVLRVTQGFLEHAGYHVLTATDGKSGLELFQQAASRIDLVLLDYSMPGMNGEEVLLEIRKGYPVVPVLLSSGYPEKEVVSGIDTRAFSGFIKKPYRSQALIHKVQQVLCARPKAVSNQRV